MEFSTLVKSLRGEGPKAEFPSHATDQDYARLLDAQDPLRTFREKFIIPSKADIEGSHVLFKPEAGSSAPKHSVPIEPTIAKCQTQVKGNVKGNRSLRCISVEILWAFSLVRCRNISSCS